MSQQNFDNLRKFAPSNENDSTIPVIPIILINWINGIFFQHVPVPVILFDAGNLSPILWFWQRLILVKCATGDIYTMNMHMITTGTL